MAHLIWTYQMEAIDWSMVEIRWPRDICNLFLFPSYRYCRMVTSSSFVNFSYEIAMKTIE